MTPRIEHLQTKKLVGIHQTMSLANNTTYALWRNFMPRRHEIQDRSSTDYISMQVYPSVDSELFSINTVFEKWAVVEVEHTEFIPDGMEQYELKGGEYAVFIHEGPASKAPETMRYIFGDWLPSSEYELDHREHFEVLPEGYNPMDPQAREEVWIPIIRR